MTFTTANTAEPYATEEAYLEDFARILKKDYGVELSDEDLKKSADNTDAMLLNILRV